MKNRSLVAVALAGALAAALPTTPAQATFPGRNGLIAFTGAAHDESDPDYEPNNGTDGEIWVVRPDGTRDRNITNDDADQGAPIWSPSGRRLLYSCKNSGSFSAAVCVMKADGSGRRQLTGTTAGNFPSSWSPDGRHILFIRWTDLNSDMDVWRMRSDGTRKRKLTEGSGDETEARWAPGGNRIVFTGNHHGNSELYLMRPDGSRIRRLTNNNHQDSAPDWSPDSRRLVFIRQRGEYTIGIWIMRVRRRVERLVRDDFLGPQGPVWSPNGKKIAFADGGNYAIYTMAPDGTNRRRITRSYREDLSPSWQPLPRTR